MTLFLLLYYTITAQLSVTYTPRKLLLAVVTLGLLVPVTLAISTRITEDEANDILTWYVFAAVLGVLCGAYADQAVQHVLNPDLLMHYASALATTSSNSSGGDELVGKDELCALLVSTAVVLAYTLAVLVYNLTHALLSLVVAFAACFTLAVVAVCAVIGAQWHAHRYAAYLAWAVAVLAPSVVVVLYELIVGALSPQWEMVCVVTGAVLSVAASMLIALVQRFRVFTLHATATVTDFAEHLADDVRDNQLIIKTINEELSRRS